jgi:hypothetical protein
VWDGTDLETLKPKACLLQDKELWPTTRLPSLRAELLQFLLEQSDALNSQAVSSLSSGGAYLNLYHLLQLDTEATLDVLRCAFVEDEIPKPNFSLHDSADENMEVTNRRMIMAVKIYWSKIP